MTPVPAELSGMPWEEVWEVQSVWFIQEQRQGWTKESQPGLSSCHKGRGGSDKGPQHSDNAKTFLELTKNGHIQIPLLDLVAVDKELLGVLVVILTLICYLHVSSFIEGYQNALETFTMSQSRLRIIIFHFVGKQPPSHSPSD